MSKSELRKLKQAKAERLKWKLYRKDPLYWLVDRFGEKNTSFEWSKLKGYTTHKWDGDKDPLASAWREVAKGNWVAIEAATGTSKTYWLSRLVFWYLDCFENSLVVTTAPKQDQLKLHLWAEVRKAFHKFKKFRQNAVLLDSLQLRVDGSVKTEFDEEDLKSSWIAVGFVAGTSADQQSATSAQGFHRDRMLIIVEETPGMSPALITAFEQTSVGTNNVIVAVGNPDSQLDALHKFASANYVKNFRISAYDYPNVVLKRDLMPGAVTQRSIDQREDKYGKESSFYKSRVRGISPKQGVSNLIRFEWIEQCSFVEVEPDNTHNAVGVDVAASEQGDKASTAWGRANTLVKLVEFVCPNASHLAYNMLYDKSEIIQKGWTVYNDVQTLDEYNVLDGCVGIDGVGVGVSTVEAFVNEGAVDVISLKGGQWAEAIPKDAQGKPMWNFISLRAQMYWELREDFRKGNIAIHSNLKGLVYDQLLEELLTIKVDSKAGSIAVERKDDIKKRLGRSPNLADCVAYWNWARKGYRIKVEDLPFQFGFNDDEDEWKPSGGVFM
jgi:phage terminase large subunit